MANDILKTLIAEALGEGPEGMRLVGETILNRAAIRGLTPEQVVRQPRQYTGLEDPGSAARRAWSDPDAIAAAQAAWELAQQPGDPTGGADHYYAQDTISAPWWAKGMTPKGEMGGHTFLSSRPLPPEELPEVATALATVPTPRPPSPVTPSIDMAQMRRISAPSQLIPDTFAGLSRPQRYLGDEIGMSPIPGGRQQAPMFDAAYDERTGEMRLTREPIDSQGMAVGRSREPAPVPALPSPQLAARRATDQTLQAALNARYPAQLPPMPPATRPVATTAVRPSASDLVRGNPVQTRNVATTIASIPTRSQVSVSDLVRGNSAFPTAAQITAATGFRPPPAIPDRLMPSEPGLPALYGGNIAGVGTNGIAPIPFQRPAQFAAAPRVAPIPFQRPTAVGTQLSVQPMPPMPIARPGIGGPFRVAPQPMPAGMRPHVGVPQIASPAILAARAVSQSGDTSVGNQADAAAARSSGSAGRNRRY